MKQYKLGEMEQKFANLIWENEPLTTKALTELCERNFEWKRTTTYTMLKRLCEREIFVNSKGTVIAIMKKEEFISGKSEEFVNETFNGSLPKFLTAFTRKNKLSKKDIEDIQKLIDEHK